MLPKVKSKLYFSGKDIDFQCLSKQLNLEATKVRKKNEWPQVSIDSGLATDFWMYQIGEEECTAISFQLDKLEDIFLPKLNVIRELINTYSLEINVVVIKTKTGNAPELVLTRENIKFLSLIHAEIGFDFYID